LREVATWALKPHASQQSVRDALLTLLLCDGDDDAVRAAAAWSLGDQCGRDPVRRALEQVALDPNCSITVRQAAGEALDRPGEGDQRSD
jgi:hypothetical protein